MLSRPTLFGSYLRINQILKPCLLSVFTNLRLLKQTWPAADGAMKLLVPSWRRIQSKTGERDLRQFQQRESTS